MTLSHLEGRTIRFLVDDAMKFLAREQRRGRTYHGIVMDPPSYGRGPGGEIWKWEDQLSQLIQAAGQVLDPQALFFLINSYTTGYSSVVLDNLLRTTLGKRAADSLLPGMSSCRSAAISCACPAVFTAAGVMKMTKWSILFEDNHLLVVEKPVKHRRAGRQQRGSGSSDAVETGSEGALPQARQRLSRSGSPAGPAGRRGHGFRQDLQSSIPLSDQIRTRQIRKQYLAVLCGRPQPACATLQDYLVKNEKRNLVHVASPREPGARAASLSYQLLEFRDGLSLVSIELQTGRPHQIRVQFSSRQWPLWEISVTIRKPSPGSRSPCGPGS